MKHLTIYHLDVCLVKLARNAVQSLWIEPAIDLVAHDRMIQRR